MPRILRALLLAFTATLALVTPASAALVINEIDYDQPSADTAEFLEIANTGTGPVELGTYSVRLINGGVTPPAQYRSFALPAVSLAAGDHFVVCGNNANVANCDLDVTPDSDLIQNGAPDAATLVNGDTTANSVSSQRLIAAIVAAGGPRKTSATATSSRATARSSITSSSARRCRCKAARTSTASTSTPSSPTRSQTTTRLFLALT